MFCFILKYQQDLHTHHIMKLPVFKKSSSWLLWKKLLTINCSWRKKRRIHSSKYDAAFMVKAKHWLPILYAPFKRFIRLRYPITIYEFKDHPFLNRGQLCLWLINSHHADYNSSGFCYSSDSDPSRIITTYPIFCIWSYLV